MRRKILKFQLPLYTSERHFGTKRACDELAGEWMGRTRAEMEVISKEEENFTQSEIWMYRHVY